MAQRSDLQFLLEALLGSESVYFQAPGSLKMVYPAITYKLDDIDSEFADNVPYRHTTRYQVTLIHRFPDNEFIMKLAALPMCVFQRHYVMNNLNHFVFNLYF